MLNVTSYMIARSGYEYAPARYEPQDDPPRETFAFDQFYYCTDEWLGRGAEGCVKTCISKSSGKEFAVKIIPKMDEETEAGVLNELKILNLGRRHHNIVEVIGAYEEEDCYLLVFEKLDSLTLSDNVFKYGPFSEHEAATVVADIASALDFLHGHGIVHRDIKLENMLSTKETFFPVKLCDFGLSFRPDEDDGDDRRSDLLTSAVGTLKYIAPEMAKLWLQEGGHYSSKCDMWSLGVALFICLSGENPIRGSNDACHCRGRVNMCEYCEEVALEKIKEGAYTMSERWNEISDEAKDLLSNLLQVDPGKRFSASQVLRHPWIRRHNPDLM